MADVGGFGVPQPDIAARLAIDPKTLRKYFRVELDRGTVEANVKVAQSLFQMATQGKNVAVAIFWMKARGGWREKSQVEHEVRQKFVLSGAPLTDEELTRIASRGLDGDGVDADTASGYSSTLASGSAEMDQDVWVLKYCPPDR